MIITTSKETEDAKKMIISDKDIGNYDFPPALPGIYCFKKNGDEYPTKYAYLSNTLESVIIVNNLMINDWCKYSWEDYVAGQENCGRIQLLNFLSELSSHVDMMKGTPYERRLAKKTWRVFSPQNTAPKQLTSLIEKIISYK